ncbi:hypothetical protein D3C76_1142400 [compost metagenome]
MAGVRGDGQAVGAHQTAVEKHTAVDVHRSHLGDASAYGAAVPVQHDAAITDDCRCAALDQPGIVVELRHNGAAAHKDAEVTAPDRAAVVQGGHAAVEEVDCTSARAGGDDAAAVVEGAQRARLQHDAGAVLPGGSDVAGVLQLSAELHVVGVDGPAEHAICGDAAAVRQVPANGEALAGAFQVDAVTLVAALDDAAAVDDIAANFRRGDGLCGAAGKRVVADADAIAGQAGGLQLAGVGNAAGDQTAHGGHR